MIYELNVNYDNDSYKTVSYTHLDVYKRQVHIQCTLIKLHFVLKVTCSYVHALYRLLSVFDKVHFCILLTFFALA